MKMRMLTLMSVILFSFAAFAADATGTWTGKMCCSEAGAYPVTLILKVNGDKVTGSLAQGNAVTDGKEGQKIENGEMSSTVITRRGRSTSSQTIRYPRPSRKSSIPPILILPRCANACESCPRGNQPRLTNAWSVRGM